MKFRIFYSAAALENIAFGRPPEGWNLILRTEDSPYFDNSPGLIIAAEGTLDIPPRDTAVLAAGALIRQEAAQIAKQFQDKLTNLQALTYEVTE